MSTTIDSPKCRTIYWHRELPPLDAEPMGEHVAEATSYRVPATLAHRDELWDRCYENLMAQARARIEQEVARLGGYYAHVLDESLDSRHDDTTGEAWLYGRFRYVLYSGKGYRQELVFDRGKGIPAFAGSSDDHWSIGTHW